VCNIADGCGSANCTFHNRPYPPVNLTLAITALSVDAIVLLGATTEAATLPLNSAVLPVEQVLPFTVSVPGLGSVETFLESVSDGRNGTFMNWTLSVGYRPVGNPATAYTLATILDGEYPIPVAPTTVAPTTA